MLLNKVRLGNFESVFEGLEYKNMSLLENYSKTNESGFNYVKQVSMSVRQCQKINKKMLVTVNLVF